MSLLTFFAGLSAPSSLLPNPRNIYVGSINGAGCTRNFQPKRPVEVEVFTVDFVNMLASGEIILSAAWTNTVSIGTDPAPGAMIQGAPTMSGSQVRQMIGGGVAGVFYAPICTITTSGGQTLVLPESGAGLLAVKA